VTSDSNHFSVRRAQSELQTMVSAFMTVSSMQQPAMEETAFSLDGIDFDIDNIDNFDVSCFFASDC
jgi:hypothetical protein